MQLTEEIYQEYLEGLLAGDRKRCARVLLDLLEGGVPVRTIYVGLFQRALYEVGALWQRNRISVAAEHIATAITEGLLNLSLPRVLSAEPLGHRVLVGAVSPELHQVGAKMVADTFEMHGWDSTFVGANTPSEDLVRLAVEAAPDVLALSLTMFFNIGALERLVVATREHLPEQRIVIGGQGLLRGGEALAARHARVDYLRGLDELDVFLARWAADGRAA